MSTTPAHPFPRAGLGCALAVGLALGGAAAPAVAAPDDPLHQAETRLLEFYSGGIGTGWEDASTVSTLLAFHETTGDQAALDLVTDFLDARLDDPQALQNDFSDDTAWWGIAAVDAYRATGTEAYLDIADRLADYIDDEFTDPARSCDGGVQWRLGDDHVATISTTLVIQLNAALAGHRVADAPEHLERALGHLAWLDEIGMYAADGTLLDGVDRNACDAPGGFAYSYMQGTAISAHLELFRATDDPQHLRAAEGLGEILSGPIYTHESGLLTSPNDAWDPCESDGALFKASSIRGLDELDAQLTGHPHSDYLRSQRDLALPFAKNHVYDIRWWESPESEYHGSANCQTSAVRMLVGAANADARGVASVTVPASVTVGAELTATAENLVPGRAYDVSIADAAQAPESAAADSADSAALAAVALERVVADDTGRLTISRIWDDSLAPGVASATLSLTDAATGTVVSSAAFAIVAAPAPGGGSGPGEGSGPGLGGTPAPAAGTAGGSAPTGVLAETGVSSTETLLGALAAMTLGGLALLLGGRLRGARAGRQN